MTENRAAQILFAVVVLVLAFYLIIWPALPDFSPSKGGERKSDGISEIVPDEAPDRMPPPAKSGERFSYEELLALLLRSQLEQAYANEKEANLRFRSEAAFRQFLSGNHAGVNILGNIDRLRAVRVNFDSYDDLANALSNYRDDYEAAPNYLVSYPGGAGSAPVPPNPEAVGFGPTAPRWLGVDADNSQWGADVKVAVLDTGVTEHSTFGREIPQVDLIAEQYGEASSETTDGHGTAMASIIAGTDPTAPGISPAAELASYRVLDGDGIGDSFTLADAIIRAVDDGAQILNLSLGSNGDSAVVRDAVAYAADQGVVMVAAAGNEGMEMLSYPAAYDDVISTGTIDARSVHMNFSNTGEGLDISAPGYEINAAWLDESFVSINGTSPSTAMVSGAIAAMVSENPGMTPAAAADILVQYSNEAGAPGTDDVFGAGVLDVGRAMQRNQPGVYDVGIASHYYNPDDQSPSDTQMVNVVVENRGTEPVNVAQLQVTTVGNTYNFDITNLAPGDIAVRRVPINSVNLNLLGEVGFTSNITVLNRDDSSPDDNSFQSIITDPNALPAAPEEAPVPETGLPVFEGP